ncbi:heterokaryon incompatibility protein-domain-containing protein [Xylaria sp. CBS 124048]|nr:heterokaryon incompatibility protein-domain-containing protein [Xylaria sp. CBS 124048]
MDEQDEPSAFGAAIIDRIKAAIARACIVYLTDCVSASHVRHALLCGYILFALTTIKKDIRWFALQTLSLILFFFGFYRDGDFSLMTLCGTYLITKTALATFGNAAFWMMVPDFLLGLDQVITDSTELAVYLVSWALLIFLSWTADICMSPFQSWPASVCIIIGVKFVQVVLIVLSHGAFPARKRAKQHEKSLSNAEIIAKNTASMYAEVGLLPQGNHIRLLKLLPLNSDEEVRCEIINHDLSNILEKYEVVSYTWGDTKDAVIRVNGRLVRTSAKVVKMLRALRHICKPRILWIDNICINQADASEKSYQVALMRHIYPRASSMIMFLDPLPDSETAIDLLHGINQSQGLTGSQESYLFGQHHQLNRLSALVRFMENDYFNRLWVTQEIVSARNIQVVCGERVIPWEDLESTMRLMGAPETARLLQRTEDLGVVACNHDSLHNFSSIPMTKDYFSSVFSSSLAFALCNFYSLKCKDPRDKVFGLLGLVRVADDPLVRPDYNKSEIQVFKDVAKYILTVEGTSKNLLPLTFAGVGHCRRLQELPSWVPDWASDMRRKRVQGEDETEVDHSLSQDPAFSYYIPSLSDYGRDSDAMMPGESRSATTDDMLGYRAALDSEANIQLIDDDVLGIQGFLVDEIKCLTSVFEFPFDEARRVSRAAMTLASLPWFEEAEALVAHAGCAYPTDQSVENIVWRTMIGDRLLETDEYDMVRPAPNECGLIYRHQKRLAADLRRASSIIGAETAAEVQDIWCEIFTQPIDGDSISEILVKVLCGQSGHPNVWKFITTGTKFANDDALPLEVSGLSDNEQFWTNRYEELCENEDTKDLVAFLLELFQVVSPENSFNMLKDLGGDSPPGDDAHDDSLGTSATDLPRKAACQGYTVSRFLEELQISLERRLCVTKNGYVGLVPSLTRIGDRVGIFYGGDTPYLVRPETNANTEEEASVLRCELVGECYMHGMMDGEMVRSENKPLWFHLV